MRVAVLTGGASSEREVSLATGIEVTRALRAAGHEAAAVDTGEGVLDAAAEERVAGEGVPREPPPPGAAGRLDARRLVEVCRLPEVGRAEVVFVALHGGSGEDGTVQALLDLLGLRYTGSGQLGCALAMDKEVSKRLFRDAGVRTPEWRTDPLGPETGEELGYPLVVKPGSGGSTVGLTVVREPDGIAAARELALRYDRSVLAERFTEGREVTVGVLDGDPLPAGEIVPEHEIFDYECKYQPEMAREIFPAELDAPVARRVQEAAVRAARALRLRDYGRIDFILDETGEPWCLEGNALPGLTSNSLVPKAAAAAGIPFPELCDRIVRAAAR